MDKYIPIPEENFFRDYLENEALQPKITINDLINKNIISDYTINDPQVESELSLLRELYDVMYKAKDMIKNPEVTDIDKLLNSIQKDIYKVSNTPNLKEISDIFVYNQSNRFNDEDFVYSTETHTMLNKDDFIDLRAFKFANWNLNYYVKIKPEFIINAHLQYNTYNMPRGIFWCKLYVYDNNNTRILDNCRELYFCHHVVDNKVTLYYHKEFNQKIYFASNKFTYEYRDFNDIDTLILLVQNDKFIKYK